jgi:hypothetical protein
MIPFLMSLLLSLSLSTSLPSTSTAPVCTYSLGKHGFLNLNAARHVVHKIPNFTPMCGGAKGYDFDFMVSLCGELPPADFPSNSSCVGAMGCQRWGPGHDEQVSMALPNTTVAVFDSSKNETALYANLGTDLREMEVRLRCPTAEAPAAPICFAASDPDDFRYVFELIDPIACLHL